MQTFRSGMPSRKKAQLAFASAVILLFLSGLAGYFSITRLRQSDGWVIHTYQVRNALADVDWSITKAGRARSGYLNSESGGFLDQFQAAINEIPGNLQRLRQLTRDNPQEQALCSRLELVTQQRISVLQQSVQARKEAPGDDEIQADLARQNVPISSEITSIMQQMRQAEQELLEIRQKTSHRFFVLMVVTLAVAFLLALEMFAVHYRFLSAELNRREQAEQTARVSEESLRRLTGRLLQLQDAERRKFSRELHDSLGQYLVGAKMNVELFIDQRKEGYLAEAIELLDHAIVETRTISHLLHPPLLDEAGLSSATKWYLEGFAQRSGIEIKADLPADMGRLPRPLELGLFRVLQESLTNIHRHSNSNKADISVECSPGQVLLSVRDYGKGIAPELLNVFQTRGTNSGVGLAGMRERVRELGGQITIKPCNPGTLIVAVMPVLKAEQPAESSAAESATHVGAKS